MSDETRNDWTEDDGFADFLRRHGAAYNPPPETPVEAIWEGIREGRGKAAGGVVPIASRRRFLPWLAVAAVLVAGIALGRISMRQASESAAPSGPAIATRTETPPAGRGDDAAPEEDPRASETPAAGDAAPSAAPGAEEAGAGALAAATGSRTDAPGAGREVRGADPTRPARPEPAPQEATRPSRPASAHDLYHLASVQMLAQAEALLVDYRTGRAAGRDDAAEIGRWAREVLASTRLLLDSRAARDLQMRALLEDLELVLAQIVHHAGADPIEGEMIDRTIEEQDLIPRLRMAIPSGGAPIGT